MYTLQKLSNILVKKYYYSICDLYINVIYSVYEAVTGIKNVG